MTFFGQDIMHATLLVSGVALLFSGNTTHVLLTFNSTLPYLKASVKVLRVNGQAVKYANDVKYLDNIASRILRNSLEPQVSL